ncbi:MAG TPA: hypothetical protein VLU95_07410 [Candidatus Acidoferrum sp.]|nr:hypothetical protein [Candidatus Acidoferrum sp.]
MKKKSCKLLLEARRELNTSISSPYRIKGWILDAYPSNRGEITVLLISEAGQRIRLIDIFSYNLCFH